MMIIYLLLLLLLLTASGYIPGGSGTKIHKKTKKNTYTLKIIHNTKITNKITQNYKHNAYKITNITFQPNKEPKVE
jgi:hypothetical protein